MLPVEQAARYLPRDIVQAIQKSIQKFEESGGRSFVESLEPAFFLIGLSWTAMMAGEATYKLRKGRDAGGEVVLGVLGAIVALVTAPAMTEAMRTIVGPGWQPNHTLIGSASIVVGSMLLANLEAFRPSDR